MSAGVLNFVPNPIKGWVRFPVRDRHSPSISFRLCSSRFALDLYPGFRACLPSLGDLVDCLYKVSVLAPVRGRIINELALSAAAGIWNTFDLTPDVRPEKMIILSCRVRNETKSKGIYVFENKYKSLMIYHASKTPKWWGGLR